MIKVTSVQLTKMNNTNNKVVALCSIILNDCFVVHKIKLIKLEDKYILVYPRINNNKDRCYAHPISSEMKKCALEAVMAAYNACTEDKINYKVE